MPCSGTSWSLRVTALSTTGMGFANEAHLTPIARCFLRWRMPRSSATGSKGVGTPCCAKHFEECSMSSGWKKDRWK
ncbi:hypothetical protein E0765_00445 [Sulfuricurvum sp. IAE1]|nr:hypothetical protein E0765_00445 [Sulfuricurvum sp. IAE1]